MNTVNERGWPALFFEIVMVSLWVPSASATEAEFIAETLGAVTAGHRVA